MAKRLAVVKKPQRIFELEPVLPVANELGKRWDFVKLGIEEVLQRSHVKGTDCRRPCLNPEHLFYRYRAEDIYQALRENRASLYMAFLRGQCMGFGICQKVASVDLQMEPYLLAWIGYSKSQETRLLYFLELENLARSLNLKEIRIFSTRKGWLRDKPGPAWETLTAYGWVKHMTPELIRGMSAAPEICQRVRVE